MTEKAPYFTPEVTEHGSLEELTLGTCGPNFDFFNWQNDDLGSRNCGGGGGGGS